MTEPASASATSAAGPAAEDRTAALLALANRHEQEGRLDEADAVLDRILSAAPAAPGALHQKGIVAFRRGRMQEAAAAMERSIGLAPGAALFHRNICEVYRALGRFDAALAAGKRAVALARISHNGAVGGCEPRRFALGESARCGNTDKA